jgi:hypothetical protein
MKTLHLAIIVMVSTVIIVMITLFLTSSGMRVHPVGFENDAGIVILKNHAYYFTTVNDTMTTYQGEGVQESFHDVTFTFFPRPFSGGPVGSCGNTNFGSYVKFPDEAHESLGVGIPGMPCRENYTQTDLTNHTNPQAGLAVYDGKIKLLVSIDNQTLNMKTQGITGIAFTSVTPYDYIARGGRSAVVIEPSINQVNLTRGTTTTVDLHVRHLAGINPFPFAYVTLSPPFGTIFYPAHLASSTTPEQRLNAEETRNLISGSLDLGTLVSFQETMPIKIAAGGEDIVKMYVSVPVTLGDEFVGQGGSLNIPIKATSGDANSTMFAQEGGVNFLIVKLEK